MQLARQGERAAAAALRRDPAHVALGLDVRAATARPEKFRANARANLELALHSLRSLQEIGAETGIAYDRATKGVLKIYRSTDSLDGAARARRVPGRARAAVTSALDVRALRRASSRRCADTARTLAGALYFARDEVGDCNKFTQGLAAACAAARRHLPLRRRRCSGIETTGGRVTGVVTDKGRIAADTVVVAMGSFTAPLLRAARRATCRSIR